MGTNLTFLAATAPLVTTRTTKAKRLFARSPWDLTLYKHRQKWLMLNDFKSPSSTWRLSSNWKQCRYRLTCSRVYI